MTDWREHGAIIRRQLLAKQHLPNPVRFFLKDGTPIRVWLATDKNGKKIIGDALWWWVNCQRAVLASINNTITEPEDATIFPRGEETKQ